MWTVPGPSGVRVARQTSPGSTRVVGSQRPTACTRTVRARSYPTGIWLAAATGTAATVATPTGAAEDRAFPW